MRVAAEMRERAKRVVAEREETKNRSAADFFKLLCLDIGKCRLLNHEEAVALILQAQQIGLHNNGIDEKISEFKSGPLSKRIFQLCELLKRQKKPNPAMNEIKVCNLRLVVSIARHYHAQNRFLTLPELVTIGCEDGLYKAAMKFDQSRGYKFSTYATWWIRHAISREIQDKCRTIRVPVHQQDAWQRLSAFKRRMWIQGIEIDPDWPAPPSVILLAKNSAGASRKTKPKTIRQLEEETFLVDKHPLTLDMPARLGSDEGLLLMNILSDTRTPSPDARVELLGGLTCDFDNSRSAVLKMMGLAGLNNAEKDVITKRFGIGMKEELTLEQIGKEFNLSRERIRQIQAKAMQKLRCVYQKFSRTQI